MKIFSFLVCKIKDKINEAKDKLKAKYIILSSALDVISGVICCQHLGLYALWKLQNTEEQTSLC